MKEQFLLEIPIVIPEGYEIDEEKSSFKKIILKEKKKILPKTWEALEGISGYYVNSVSITHYNKEKCVHPFDKNLFVTKEQAEATISCAMYSQLLNAYKDVSVTEFIEIAKEYEPKVRPMLGLFFAEYAEAAFYYGLLVQLRDEYRQGWKPRLNEDRYVIGLTNNNEFNFPVYTLTDALLSFQSAKVRGEFYNNFKELIEKARPLMS